MHLRRSFSALIFVSAVFISLGIAPSQPQHPVSYTALMPLEAWQKEFQIIDGKDRGKVVAFEFQHDPADRNRWKMTFGDYARATLRRGADGALMMERLELIKAKSYIVYEPALPVLPGEAGAEPAISRETAYKMYSAETGKLKRAGRVTHQVKRTVPWKFTTPAGIFDGYYVELEHGMEMEYHSHLQLTIGLGCRLNEGPIYGMGQYKLNKLGLFTETKTTSAALAKP